MLPVRTRCHLSYVRRGGSRSATIGTCSIMEGNILALQSITMNDYSTLIGRALARDGSVTMGSGNTISPQ